mmetsp:Transcript_102694/g.257449  ORF Transcript_102694/g.257449 Transcript_102694/m.257449 type:complete len:84 (+) Transcript_102694:94-345(+)
MRCLSCTSLKPSDIRHAPLTAETTDNTCTLGPPTTCSTWTSTSFRQLDPSQLNPIVASQTRQAAANRVEQNGSGQGNCHPARS